MTGQKRKGEETRVKRVVRRLFGIWRDEWWDWTKVMGMKTARRKIPQSVRDPFFKDEEGEQKLKLKRHTQQKIQSDSEVWILDEWKNDRNYQTWKWKRKEDGVVPRWSLWLKKWQLNAKVTLATETCHPDSVLELHPSALSHQTYFLNSCYTVFLGLHPCTCYPESCWCSREVTE